MPSAWTGGQYSFVRVLLSFYLAGAFIAMTGMELAALPLGIGAALLCVPLALGWYDQWFAAALVVIGFVLHLIVPELYLVESLQWWAWVPGVILLAHLLTPLAPYGSLDAAGRTDPAGDWRYPPWLFFALWLIVGAFYLWHSLLAMGIETWRLGEAVFHQPLARPTFEALVLPDPLARGLTWILWGTWLAFVPLAVPRTTRPLGWALVLVVNLLVLIPAGFPGLAISLAALHLLIFDPRWLAQRIPDAPETVFYDGYCGLCHRWARFVLAEDLDGRTFILAPLQGDFFKDAVPPEQRETLPDSIIVLRGDGQLLTRSTAVLHILDQLGGYWRILAALCRAVPRPVRDWVYDRIAAIRRTLFAPPPETCPISPPHLRERFRF